MKSNFSEEINTAKNRQVPVTDIAKCIIFDLDGTLVNTIDDLGLACDYLLKQKGITPEWTVEDYKSFVGNGAKLLVERAFEGRLSSCELEEQYGLFKKKYNEIKMEHAHAYEGMKEIVSVLKNAGLKLVVCTNKPDLAAKGMVEDIFGKGVFDVIQGALDDKPKKPDPAVAKEILNDLGIKPKECIWIGDSDVDIKAAHNLGCRSVAVTWGFRSFESLFACCPTLIIDSPKDILKIFNFNIDN